MAFMTAASVRVHWRSGEEGKHPAIRYPHRLRKKNLLRVLHRCGERLVQEFLDLVLMVFYGCSSGRQFKLIRMLLFPLSNARVHPSDIGRMLEIGGAYMLNKDSSEAMPDHKRTMALLPSLPAAPLSLRTVQRFR